jgi:hypothetical protein
MKRRGRDEEERGEGEMKRLITISVGMLKAPRVLVEVGRALGPKSSMSPSESDSNANTMWF